MRIGILKLIIVIGLFFWWAKPALAGDVTMQFFWAATCPHCAKEKIFIEKLTTKYPDLKVNSYEVTNNKANWELLKQTAKNLGTEVSGVPFTVVGEKYFVGYFNDETTGKQIEETVKCACNHEVSSIDNINLPLLGKVEIKTLSLPVLTFVLALLDGFNPCAMWTLLFLVSLLLGMNDRKRMWFLGTAFIVTSALVYFLFLSAWLNLFLFLGMVIWIRTLIGLVALGAGSYYFWDYWTNKNGGCKVAGGEKRRVVFEQLQKIVKKQQLIFALSGIILLAIAVNMIELVCSAGLPAVYTKVLSLSGLPLWQYYLYLIFYVFIFMLDDLFVFITAMVSLQIVGIQSKYSRFSHLIGGFLMLLIGLLLLFKPEWLMFG